VRPVALAQVAAVSRRVSIPVIGMGGIATGRDAQDFLAAGATAIAVGTESFRDPAAGARIGRELAALAPPPAAAPEPTRA
jgi:dihydroorotate dehydrogenase (NAD+) catalytic subunit